MYVLLYIARRDAWVNDYEAYKNKQEKWSKKKKNKQREIPGSKIIEAKYENQKFMKCSSLSFCPFEKKRETWIKTFRIFFRA